MSKINLTEVFNFYKQAGAATYAGYGQAEKHPQRPDFREFLYTQGEYEYRDSYAGFYRSRGTEVVRFQGKPIWTTLYGGGMIKGFEPLANTTFEFLKLALRQQLPIGVQNMRGSETYTQDKWVYKYHQEGDLSEFIGYEEIFFNQDLVFFHRIIGGEIISQS